MGPGVGVGEQAGQAEGAGSAAVLHAVSGEDAQPLYTSVSSPMHWDKSVNSSGLVGQLNENHKRSLDTLLTAMMAVLLLPMTDIC